MMIGAFKVYAPASTLVVHSQHQSWWRETVKLVVDVTVFDVFVGPSVGEGRKSVALSVTLQPVAATMTDAEIDAVAGKVVANVEKQTGGSLRG